MKQLDYYKSVTTSIDIPTNNRNGLGAGANCRVNIKYYRVDEDKEST